MIGNQTFKNTFHIAEVKLLQVLILKPIETIYFQLDDFHISILACMMVTTCFQISLMAIVTLEEMETPQRLQVLVSYLFGSVYNRP